MSEFKERGENRRKTHAVLTEKGLFKRHFGDRQVITTDRRKSVRREGFVLYDHTGNEIFECE